MGAANNLAENEQKRIKSGSSRRATRFMGDITETSCCDGEWDRRLRTSLATSVRSIIVGSVSKLRVRGFEESARNYKDHPGVSIKKYQDADWWHQRMAARSWRSRTWSGNGSRHGELFRVDFSELRVLP